MGLPLSRHAWIVLVAVVLAACSSPPQELVEKHTRRGDKYAAEQKFREAAIEYKNAVKADPKNAKLRWKLAQALLDTRDYRGAYKELGKIHDLDPANLDAAGKLAEMHLAAGKLEEARAIADNLVASRPSDPQGHILLSGLDLKDGKVDQAFARLVKASELDPKNIRPLITLGNLSLVRQDRKGALEWYGKAVAADPRAAEPRIALGNFHFATGDREEGEKAFRQAIALSEDKESVRLALAEHYLYQNRHADAEKELDSMIREGNSQKARKALAEIRIEQGKGAEAKPIVDEILGKNEKDLDGKYLKGRIALAERRFDEAKALFGEVLKQDARNANARLYNGVIEVVQGRFDAGRKDVEEAVKTDPGNQRARLVLADLHLKSGNPEAAEKEALEVLRRNRSNFPAAVLYGDALMVRKEYGKAGQIYSAIAKQVPSAPIGHFKLGLLAKRQGKAKEAAEHFRRAVERKPDDLGAINEYVFALLAAREAPKAERVVLDLLSREPNNPFLHDLAGRFRVATGKAAEAEGAFLKALEIAPDYTAPAYELGMLYVSQNRLPAAEARFRKVLEKNDRNAAAHTILGIVLNGQGKAGEANTHYRRALEISPKNPLAANNLAANLADGGGNLDEALKFAQVAKEAAPEDANVSDTLGWIYYRKGLYETAYPLLADASKRAGKNAVVRYHHGMILAKKGRNREAASELAAAIAIDPKFEGNEDARRTLASLR